MPQPAPVLQCGHHTPAALSIAGTLMTLQQRVHPAQPPARIVRPLSRVESVSSGIVPASAPVAVSLAVATDPPPSAGPALRSDRELTKKAGNPPRGRSPAGQALMGPC